MFSNRPMQALCALLLALAVMVLSAPGAAAHPGPHHGDAVAVGETGTAPAADAAPCCHVGGACSAPLCGDPGGALSRLPWSWADLLMTAGARPASLAGGADPPPPRG